MASWNWITDRVATGGQIRTAAEVAELKAAGITHVLDVIEHWRGDPGEAALVADAGLAYLNNPTADDWTVKPVQWFKGQPRLRHASAGEARHGRVRAQSGGRLAWTVDGAGDPAGAGHGL
jgi:hypothetical protein